MPSDKIIYRHYQEGDLSGITKIYHAAYCDYNFGLFRFCVLRSSGYMKWKYIDRPGFKPESIQIAEYKGKIVGLIVVAYTQFQFNGQTYKIGSVNNASTCPILQRRRIASTLMNNSLDYIRSEGWDASSLITDPNGRVIRYLKRRGYQEIIYIRNWFKFIDFKNMVCYIPLFLFLFPVYYSLKFYTSKKKKKQMSSDICIRYLKSSEISEYLSLLNRCGNELISFSPYSTKYFKWWRLQRPKGNNAHNLVAIKNDRIIGGISIIESEVYAGFRKLKIFLVPELFVDPSERNKGIGSLLLSEGERVAIRNGCGILSAFIHENDVIYSRFMKKNGYFRTSKTLFILKPMTKDFTYPKKLKKAWYIPLEQVGY